MDVSKVVIQPPPPYKESSTSRKSLMVAVVIACMFAISLVTVCVVGGVYISQLKGDHEKDSTDDFDYSVNITLVTDFDQTIPETARYNRKTNEELVEQRDEYGNLDLVFARNFDTRVEAVYSVSRGECYLYHILETGYNNVDDIISNEYHSETNLPDPVSVQNATRTQHFLKDSRPLTDLSVVPHSIRSYCHHRPTYWLTSSESCSKQGRIKRAAPQGDKTDEKADDGGVIIICCWCICVIIIW